MFWLGLFGVLFLIAGYVVLKSNNGKAIGIYTGFIVLFALFNVFTYHLNAGTLTLENLPIVPALIIILSVYFVLTIHPIVNYVKTFKENKDLQMFLSLSKSDAEKEKKALIAKHSAEMIDLKSKYDEALKAASSSGPDVTQLQSDVRTLRKLYFEKEDECKALKRIQIGYEKEIFQLKHEAIRELRKETWGDILKRHGNARFNLSRDDYAAIKYPPLNKDCVYYAASTGKSYHAVQWCYALDTAAKVYYCSLASIKDTHKPCSYCIKSENGVEGAPIVFDPMPE